MRAPGFQNDRWSRWIFVAAFASAIAALPHDTRAGDDASLAADIAPYDAGYAAEAAAGCPGTKLTIELPPDKKADPEFKRGQDMFKRYVESMKAEGACKAALKLYDAESGKVAKVLRQQK